MWQYSTDGGGSWSAIDTGVSATSALLLAPADRVRFLPNDGFVGNPLATITFLAWDQTTGTVDMPDNTTLLPGSGGFSTTSATASITVYPVLSIGGTGTSASLDDQTSQPFNTATIGDSDSADPGEMVTITITQTDAADGTLSSPDTPFTSDAGGVYVVTVSAADATADLEAMVFTPTLHQVSPGESVATEFSIQLTDSFSPLNTVVDNASILTVKANAVPQLTGANNFASIPENVASANDAGATVASMIAGKSSDTDGDTLGIAIISIDDGNGQWEYSTGVGQPWIPIGSVSATSVLLLAPTDLVHFLPNADFFGNATIQFLAWDQTVGTATQPINPTTLPGSGAFSTTSATASIQVVAPATIFVGSPDKATNDETPLNLFAAAFGSQMAGMPAPGITDPNTPTQIYTVTVVNGTPANGSIEYAAGSGWTTTGVGTYQFTGTAAAANVALEALVFVPTEHQVEAGDPVVTNFTITVNDGVTVPTSNDSILLTTTAVNDAPTFVSVSTPFNVPVIASPGATVGTVVASEVDFDPNVSYAIIAGNPSGDAYAISTNGTITVANSASLVYSATPTVLTITATNTDANGLAGPIGTTTRSIALWEVTASATAIGASSSTMLSVALISGSPFTLPVTINWDDGRARRKSRFPPRNQRPRSPTFISPILI